MKFEESSKIISSILEVIVDSMFRSSKIVLPFFGPRLGGYLKEDILFLKIWKQNKNVGVSTSITVLFRP